MMRNLPKTFLYSLILAALISLSQPKYNIEGFLKTSYLELYNIFLSSYPCSRIGYTCFLDLKQLLKHMIDDHPKFTITCPSSHPKWLQNTLIHKKLSIFHPLTIANHTPHLNDQSKFYNLTTLGFTLFVQNQLSSS